MFTEQIDTGKAYVSRTPEGPILIQIREDQEIGVKDIKAISEAKMELAQGEPYTVIFVTPVIGDITHEARILSASKEVNKNAIAKAIIATSLSGRIISTFFINIMKPPVPTRLFSCRQQATAWLLAMRAQASE